MIMQKILSAKRIFYLINTSIETDCAHPPLYVARYLI